ncbi:hypothetical protein Golax_022478 [Gossypium laxum]|uniref:RNase H type-1 domain-containing protein n=1 Tax=Gossypium laxum TaxID=34288 RepID=A0A7J9B1P9_9ROSI|nr:hypothetical protein [Gossypium laxum]
MAEVRACLHAVIFAEELGFREVYLEGEALFKVNIRCILRTANETAHALAVKERQFDAPVYWMEEVPKEVERFINCDRWRFEASKKAWWILSLDVDWWLIFDELSRYRGVGKLRKDSSDER